MDSLEFDPEFRKPGEGPGNGPGSDPGSGPDDGPDGPDGGLDVGGAGLVNLTGKQIGRYLIGQQLGSGGAATVYRAYDQVQGITVALKLLLPGADEKAYDRFRREATLAGALRHPHIVRILQIGIAPKGEVAYIAMELVEGESLADLLLQRGRLRPEETANVLEPIARALAYAHRQGVVHRDVKPSNILLRTVSPGAPNSVQLEALEHPVVPLLTDFGIARALDAPELTSAGRTVGTPAYMAPEQCAGSREVDGRADIYSLGAVFYRCITGRLPFNGTTTQILHAHVYDPLTIDDSLLRLLPPIAVDILRRSMAKRPEDRYPNAAAMADALALAAGRLPISPDAPTGDTNTATLTLSAMPAVLPPPAPSASTVLVPGLGEQPAPPQPGIPPGAVAGAAAAAAAQATPRTNPLLRPAPPPAAQATGGNLPPVQPPVSAQELDDDAGFGGRLERLNWPGMALAAVLGLFVILLVVAFMQGPGLLGRLIGGGATPTPGQVSQVTGTPGIVPGGVLTATFTATPTVLPTATLAPATATVLPTATATATSLPPTDVPTLAPTSTPVPPTDTPTPTITATATLSPTETPTTTPTPGPDPTIAACLGQIDPGLQPYILQQPPDVQAAIGCPAGPPLSGMASSQRFERGYIVAFDMTDEMLVVYNDSQTWERQVPPANEPMPSVDPPTAGNLFVPSGRIGWLWAQGERRNTLGYALAPDPGQFEAVYQVFPGAAVVLNRTSNEVVSLPTANQR